MAGTLITVSDAFRAALVAQGNTGTNAHKVVSIGLATAAFDSSNKKLTALPNELKRINTFGGQNVAADTIHVTLQDSTNAQYTLWGFGFYLDDGTLAAYYSNKSADGPIMEKSPAAQLLLSVDTQFASIDAATLSFPSASFLNPPATETVQGVIEIATQAETDAGTDNSRAITPRKAAARYAPLNRPSLTGPVTVTGTPATNEGHVALKPPSGALSRESKLRFHGTFSGSATDTGVRHVASIRGGFDGGSWGREYLDIYINSANNDNESDINQSRAMRLTYGGRALIGSTADDGSNALQVSGSARAGNYFINSQSIGDSGVFGFGNANGPAVATYGSGTSNAGALVLKTAGVERVRVNAAGRMLVGTSTDDGVSLLQVNGTVKTVGQILRGTESSITHAGLKTGIQNHGTAGDGSISTARWSADATGSYVILGKSRGAAVGTQAALASGDTLGTIFFTGSDGSDLQSAALINATAVEAYSATTRGTRLDFQTTPAGSTTRVQSMRLADSGRVLVGTIVDDGAHQLQVGGSISAGTIKAVAPQAAITASNGGGTGQTSISLRREGALADQKVWEFLQDSNGALRIRTVNDGYTSSGNPLWITRGAGYASGNMLLMQDGGRVIAGPTTDDGSTMLQVGGSVRASNYYMLGQGATDSGVLGFGNSNGPAIGMYGSGVSGAGALVLRTAGIERARLNAAGRLLVGTVTDNGTDTLQVLGPTAGYAITALRNGSTSSQYIGIGAAPAVPTSNIVDNHIDSYSSPSNAKPLVLASTTDANNTLPTSGSVGINLQILGVNKLSVNQAGRVLINTGQDDGANQLQVSGNGRISGKLIVQPSGAAGAWVSSDATRGYFQSYGDTVVGAAAGNTIFTANNTERMRINAAGRVLVGTTTDDGLSQLQAAGDTLFGGNMTVKGSGGTAVSIDSGASGRLNQLILKNGGVSAWAVQSTSANRFQINRYDNTGALADTSFAIDQPSGVAVFSKTPTAPTAAAGDSSAQLATTQFVSSAILNDRVGQIVYEPRTSVRAGYLKLNGSVLKRADYPALWAYAQASGAIVSDSAWGSNNFGCFSTGDGATTFRIPELRGESIRCWDDGRGIDSGRGIGTWQDSQNRSHAHGAFADGVGDHSHSAWSDAQGWHSHGGGTTGVGDHQHGTAIGQNSNTGMPWGIYDGNNNHHGIGTADNDNALPWSSPAGAHSHGINGDGTHSHGVGIGNAGTHTHTIHINADGGNETRVRSVAMLAMIRAY